MNAVRPARCRIEWREIVRKLQRETLEKRLLVTIHPIGKRDNPKDGVDEANRSMESEKRNGNK